MNNFRPKFISILLVLLESTTTQKEVYQVHFIFSLYFDTLLGVLRRTYPARSEGRRAAVRPLPRPAWRVPLAGRLYHDLWRGHQRLCLVVRDLERHCTRLVVLRRVLLLGVPTKHKYNSH